MVRDRAQLVIVGGGAVGAVLLAFVLAYGQPPNGSYGSGNTPKGGPQGGSGRPNGGGPQGHDNRGPVYQRHAGEGKNWGGDWRRSGYPGRPWMTPQVSGGWFQRPYPYHLDYYKMRWGGSYAPYFGNLYGVPFGTPQVVNGGWGPGAGGWGPEGGTVPPQGYEWMDGASNGGSAAAIGAVVDDKTAVDSNSTNEKSASQATGGESLPAPNK